MTYPSACCDFHDTRLEIIRHWKQWEVVYGKDANGEPLVPPPGWKLLKLGELVHNSRHREFDKHSGWLAERSGASTMTPVLARPNSHVLGYAVPLTAGEHVFGPNKRWCIRSDK